jgi:hypothetical protein
MKKTFAVLALAALTSMTSTASAQTIQACYVTKTGTVYRINVADTPPNCGKNVAFHWNVTGPTGQTGQTGPQGPAGPGSSYSFHSTDYELTGGFGGNTNCPEGSTATGGGYLLHGTVDPGIRVSASMPYVVLGNTLPTGWMVLTDNPNAAPYKITLYVVCVGAATP